MMIIKNQNPFYTCLEKELDHACGFVLALRGMLV